MYVDSGVVLRCNSIEVDFNNWGVVFINGMVISWFCGEGKCLIIKISSGEFYIGVDGILG